MYDPDTDDLPETRRTTPFPGGPQVLLMANPCLVRSPAWEFFAVEDLSGNGLDDIRAAADEAETES